MPQILITTLQIIVALGLLNVWLVRSSWNTEYRGGNAKNIVEEFAVYGLPKWFCYFIGFLKVGSALLLLAGIWISSLQFPATVLILFLMIGAVSMHIKVGDPLKKSIPAALMLTMSVILCAHLLY